MDQSFHFDMLQPLIACPSGVTGKRLTFFEPRFSTSDRPKRFLAPPQIDRFGTPVAFRRVLATWLLLTWCEGLAAPTHLFYLHLFDDFFSVYLITTHPDLLLAVALAGLPDLLSGSLLSHSRC